MTNSKQTKRALLSSVMALLLCFTMLLGTTFAWFTDTASTSVNTIQAGTLDVMLEMWNGQSWVDASGETLSFTENYWEPGCTYSLPELRIRNNGNLALKYKVVITGIKGDAELNKAIDWTIDGMVMDHEYVLNAEATQNFTISGHMKESAGNEYMGKKIEGISITVYATQATVEVDGTGSNQYDKDANYSIPWDGELTAPAKDESGVYHITNASEFAQYITELNNHADWGEHRYDMAKVVLDNDIDFAGAVFTASAEGYMFSGSFDGQGYTVSNFTIKRTDGANYTGLFSVYMDAVGSVKNLTVKNATVESNGAQVSAIIPSINHGNNLVDNCHVINCTIIGEKKVGAVTGYNSLGTVSNCSASGNTIIASDSRAEQATLFGYNNGGTFTNNTDKGGNTISTNATYITNGVVLNNGVYEISNANGMFWMADCVNSNSNYFNGKTVELTADIDLQNKPWTPIGATSNYEFRGTFDGKGHTIKNLNVSEAADVDVQAGIGLFGWVGNNGGAQGYIKNVTIDGATVSGSRRVGVVAGYFQWGSIENCTVKNATVTCTHKDAERCGDKAGAVIGMVASNAQNSVVKNCKAENCVVKAARDAGQVIGMAYTSSGYVTDLTATNVTVSEVENNTCNDKPGTNINNTVVGREG